MLVGSLASNGTVVRIPENLHTGTVFMQLRTQDPDVEASTEGLDNTTIRLQGCRPKSSNGRGPFVSVFEVDKLTGKSWTTGTLDREAATAYLCILTAEDGEKVNGLTST